MRYLFKIMPTLTRAGIITSQRGVGGGYILAKDPAEISLLDVIEAIEGPIRLNRCLIDEQFCSKHGPPDCPVHNALAGIQRRLTAEFDKVRFSDLLG
jgi:Rrf2 family protein